MVDPSVDEVTEGDLSALVKERRGTGPAGPQDLVTNFQVLESVGGQVDVLPIRQGVALSLESLRRRVLTDQAPRFRARLEALRGLVELRLRYFYQRDAVLAELVRESREIQRLRGRLGSDADDATLPLRLRLGELVAEALERRRLKDAARLAQRLRDEGEDIRTARPAGEMGILSASVLVTRRDAPRVRDEGLRLAEEGSPVVAVRLVGPIPPWSFVDSPPHPAAAGAR
jgi:hypothetical protein